MTIFKTRFDNKYLFTIIIPLWVKFIYHQRDQTAEPSLKYNFKYNVGLGKYCFETRKMYYYIKWSMSSHTVEKCFMYD